jgi:hypothetical protein
MKKILVLFLLAMPLMAQTPIRSFSDSLHFGDSTNTHTFANPHSFFRITITSDTASSSADTVFVFAGTTTALLAPVGVRYVVDANQYSNIVPGLVSAESSRKVYWIYLPGGAYYVKLTRCTTVLSKVKYTIESFN